MKTRTLQLMVCLAVVCGSTLGPAAAFHIIDTISPSITANPVEVVIWVMDGVTPADEARTLAQIEQGLQLWEDVPTSHIAFEIVSVIHATHDPGRLSHQLKIIVGNDVDINTGGALWPINGNPGIWYGALADDPTLDLVLVTAHEVGHAIGFGHSTLSKAFPVEQHPVMHWKHGGAGLLLDDIAAASTAYPVTGIPATTATIRGRLVVEGEGFPVTGINVVAIDASTDVAAVARLSGESGPPGSFELPYLPPGSYDLAFLDAESYRGSGLGLPADYQADNFDDFSFAGITVSAGDDFDAGDIEVALHPLTLDGIHHGSIGLGDSSITIKPLGPGPPDAFLGQPYEVWFLIGGGLRFLSASVSGLPTGLTGSDAHDPRFANVRVAGRQFVRLAGTPLVTGDFTITMDVLDARGQAEQFVVDLEVRIACGDDIDADGTGDCSDTCLDLDRDGYGLAGGGGNSCLGSDCVEGNMDVYPGAPELNDAMDNQCPGDGGFGLVDELPGQSMFDTDSGDLLYAWPDQLGATLYEVARSTTADFSSGCEMFYPTTSELLDSDLPLPGQAYYYLAHSAAPHVGSWGISSTGERTVICPDNGPDLIVQSLTHSPASPVQGQTITFTAVVKNIGSRAADTSTLSFRVGGESLQNPNTHFAIPVLQPGQSVAIQRQSMLTPGLYIQTATADLFDEIVEKLETNNQLQDVFTVAPP